MPLLDANAESLEFGIVKTFDLFKGYGFIQRPKGKDLFVFYDDIVDSDITLCEGSHVAFVVIQTPKGPRATKVRIVT